MLHIKFHVSISNNHQKIAPGVKKRLLRCALLLFLFLQRDPQKAHIHDQPNIFAEDREKIHRKMAELCDGDTYKKKTKKNKNPETKSNPSALLYVYFRKVAAFGSSSSSVEIPPITFINR